MRSPSFSREMESRTMMGWPEEKAVMAEAMVSKAGWVGDIVGFAMFDVWIKSMGWVSLIKDNASEARLGKFPFFERNSLR